MKLLLLAIAIAVAPLMSVAASTTVKVEQGVLQGTKMDSPCIAAFLSLLRRWAIYAGARRNPRPSGMACDRRKNSRRNACKAATAKPR